MRYLDILLLGACGDVKTRLSHLFVMAALICTGCLRQSEARFVARPGRDAVSPSGKYVLRVVQDTARSAQVAEGRFPFYRFEVRHNQPGKALEFACETAYIATHRLVFMWDSKDRIWVYSGDVGTFYWTRETQGVWRKAALAEEPTDAPPLIRKLSGDDR